MQASSPDIHPSVGWRKQLHYAESLLFSMLQPPPLKRNLMIQTAALGCGFTTDWASAKNGVLWSYLILIKEPYEGHRTVSDNTGIWALIPGLSPDPGSSIFSLYIMRPRRFMDGDPIIVIIVSIIIIIITAFVELMDFLDLVFAFSILIPAWNCLIRLTLFF